MTSKQKALEMKKLTLIAWTRLLHKEGVITLTKCNKMIALIERLSS